jgi:Lrp/AsnC family transcriptional regulator, regulator for asnA, asnC and gidA
VSNPPPDELDNKILEQLRQNGRRSNVDIAAAVGASEGTVRRRVDKLLRSGAVKIIAAVNPLRMGYRVEVFFCLRVQLDKLESIASELARYEEVNYVGLMTGSFDLLVHAHFASNEEVFDFIRERIASIAGVNEFQTLHVLNVIKRANRWIPIECEDERQITARPQR